MNRIWMIPSCLLHLSLKPLKSFTAICIAGSTVFVLVLGYLNFALPTANVEVRAPESSRNFVSRKVLCADVDELNNKAMELENHLKEMEEIKMAGIREITRIEEKVFKLNEEIKHLQHNRDLIRENTRSLQREVLKAKLDLKKMQYAEVARQREKIVPVGLPLRFEGEKAVNLKHDKADTQSCTFSTCFDYSACPITSQFSISVYNPASLKYSKLASSDSTYLYEKIHQLPFYSSSFPKACLYVVVLDITPVIEKDNQIYMIEETLHNLKYWERNGQNHILFFVHKHGTTVDCSIFDKVDVGMALVVYDLFCKSAFRNDFDIILPLLPSRDIDKQHLKWKLLKALLPLKRKYLFNIVLPRDEKHPLASKVREQDLQAWKASEKVYAQLYCTSHGSQIYSSENAVNCKDMNSLYLLYEKSVFTVLLLESSSDVSSQFYSHFFATLSRGSIPVLLGNELPLPFDGLISWEEFAVLIPISRLPELHYILETIGNEDVFQLKRQGRLIWEMYFSSSSSIMETAFAVVRSKIKIPPLPFPEFVAPVIENQNQKKGNSASEVPPLFSLPSKAFAHNWTHLGLNAYLTWNRYPGAHRMTPSIPFNFPLPSSFQFSTGSEYLPIGDGQGGDGVPFSKAIGGDFPIEHFCIVLLTYDREAILVDSLQRLAGLRFLNRVIVVWNNPVMPSPDLQWPDIGVEIHVIRPGKNSLNNRFLPYDLIDTDAVLSMDDDIYLRHDEIDLAFRVWRANRDRIVGFPGRFHSWENEQWHYNANYTCEISMVLTGGAFFHKFYSYLYTYSLSPSVRDLVDEFMNCEDIAMNFLVSHVTRKPPIKVTSRWTFRCPGCPNSLSADASHFSERGECIHRFEQIFGYIPLLRTQFRADSVLFKTRVPPGKTKCYQFV